jgi:TonB family protein
MKIRILPLFVIAFLGSTSLVWAQAERPPRLAILDLGKSEFGRIAADDLYAALAGQKELTLLNREQSRAAARGSGYAGSLNMALADARDLGAVLGCDFFVTGDAETLRRSASDRPVYYESYAAIFLVSARSGRLLAWQRPSVKASTPDEASKPLRAGLMDPGARQWLVQTVMRAMQAERNERARAIAADIPVIEEAPDGDTPATKGLQTPRPFRRLRPAYPSSAAAAEAEATVDALVDIDEQGEVGRVQIVRWGGFGLDDATEETVQQMHFYPAMRNGKPIPMRVLLRYNFRKPPPDPKK